MATENTGTNDEAQIRQLIGDWDKGRSRQGRERVPLLLITHGLMFRLLLKQDGAGNS